MIRCNLSTMLGSKKLKVADIVRETGIHRNTLTALYNDKAKRIDLEVIDLLCEFFDCSVCDLFERVD